MNTHQKKTIKTYDTIAASYGQVNYASFWVPEFKKFKRLVHGKKVLDIGCGAGRDAEMFVQAGFNYMGIDASRGMLKIAAERVPSAKFLKMDFFKLKFPANSFDGFWASASFLHVPKKDLDTVLREAKRILQPSSVGFISVKEKTTMDEGIVQDARYHTPVARYFAFYEKMEFKRRLQNCGFKVISITKHLENDDRKLVWLCYFVRKLT